jgi:growth arrest-specific protein 8
MSKKSGAKKANAKEPKLTAEQAARAKADEVKNPEDAEFILAMQLEISHERKKVDEENKLKQQYALEKDRINSFLICKKKEMAEKRAELNNKEREYEEVSESYQIKTKQKKQMVKHLHFQNQDQLTDLKKEALSGLKRIEEEDRVNLRELKADTRAAKVKEKEQEVRQIQFITSLQSEFDKIQTQLRSENERKCNEIKNQYKHKMDLLRQEMEDKRKSMIKAVGDKKAAQVQRLTEEHATKYSNIKSHYGEIIMSNFDMLTEIKKDVDDDQTRYELDEKMLKDAERDKKRLQNPLNAITGEIKKLEGDYKKQERDLAELEILKNQIQKNSTQLEDIEWQYEVKKQQFMYLTKEKDNLFKRFNDAIYEVHQKSGLKNLILEKKLETLEEALEVKDAQLNQILSSANINQEDLQNIRASLEEVESLKNDSIREIQQELKKIREAHFNMVKTYEGKLQEFGIPVEELGFDPLVPANIN